MSKTEIYRQVKKGAFPAPRRISHRVSVWQASAVEAWVLKTLDPDAASLL